MNKKRLAVTSIAIATSIISVQIPSLAEGLEEGVVDLAIESEDISKSDNSNYYRVYQGKIELGEFDTSALAVEEAKKWTGSIIEQNGKVIWNFGDHLYSVRQGNNSLGVYSSRETAIVEAIKWSNSRVEHGGETVWSFGDHLYKVKQKGVVLGTYNSRSQAIAEAVKWNGSTVERDGKAVWTFGDHLYKVKQKGVVLGTYSSRSQAIAEAVKWNGSTIEKDGERVWNFGDHLLYQVKYGSSVLGTFKSKDQAIKEAIKWRNSVIEQNGKVIWKYQDERVLGSYTTSFNAGQINRSHNVAVAARAINGTIVRPGQVFSFNNTTGRRSIANGYREATVIVGGEFVPGLGGGVCQTSTTLYNAVLGAGLQVVERHPHSLPVSYVPPGRDATVAFGALDFKFRNNRSSNIRIEAFASGGRITVKIHGR